MKQIVYLPRPSRMLEYINSRFRSLDIESGIVDDILEQYGLNLISAPVNIPIGRRSRNIILNTDSGKMALKRYRKKWRTSTVNYGHSILAQLATLDFPASKLVNTLSEQTCIKICHNNYALFDFEDGINFSATYLSHKQQLKLHTKAGKILAQFHRCLQGFTPVGSHHLGFNSYTEGRERDLAWHTNKLNELQNKSSVISNPEDKRNAEWLIQHKNAIIDKLASLESALTPSSLPRLIIHGDYGIHNLLFRPDGSAIVLDFELSRLEWRLSEIVMLISRLDMDALQSFMHAYQADYPLTQEERQFLPDVWRLRKIQSAVQAWETYFELGGASQKLLAARKLISQADNIENVQSKIQFVSAFGAN